MHQWSRNLTRSNSAWKPGQDVAQSTIKDRTTNTVAVEHFILPAPDKWQSALSVQLVGGGVGIPLNSQFSDRTLDYKVRIYVDKRWLGCQSFVKRWRKISGEKGGHFAFCMTHIMILWWEIKSLWSCFMCILTDTHFEIALTMLGWVHTEDISIYWHNRSSLKWN